MGNTVNRLRRDRSSGATNTGRNQTSFAVRLEAAEDQARLLTAHNLSAYHAHKLAAAISDMKKALPGINRVLRDNRLYNRNISLEIFTRNESIVHDLVRRYLNHPTEIAGMPNIDNVVASSTNHVLSLLSPAHITQRDIDNNKGTCCICQDDYKVEEPVVQCPECENFYHRHCIDRWLLENETCPQCRKLLR